MQHDPRQTQFLTVITRDEATARFQKHLRLAPLGREIVPLGRAVGRILADDILASVDVPGFDRSNVDGFALQAADTFGAEEEATRAIALNDEVLSPGVAAREAVTAGRATMIATGGMLPRGADAVVMVEHTDLRDDGRELVITRAVVPGENVSYAGTDIAKGETVLRAGQLLTSREVGVLGGRRTRGSSRLSPTASRDPVHRATRSWRRARLARPARSTTPMRRSSGPRWKSWAESRCSSASSPTTTTRSAPRSNAASQYDLVVLSGGTSKGAGDLSYRVVSRLSDPGIVAHGVALKPGKPICLAVTSGKPVVILPGFPTSAIFTFHEFVAPVIRAYAGLVTDRVQTVTATLPMRVNSERGRTEYLLVGLVRAPAGLVAYPMGKGSGSVTAFSGADGFITIDQHTEIVDAGSTVSVQLLGQKLEPADLIIVGSHCVGLDLIIGKLLQKGIRAKALFVGSMGGLAAARRGECDVAGIHLMDPKSGEYNRHVLTDTLALVPGYGRMQGIVHRKGDARFDGRGAAEALAAALQDPDCAMVNRNTGSGTRIIVDKLLGDRRPPGYAIQTKSHNAVAAAVQQGRADWGVAIGTMADQYGLDFIPLQPERYDFLVPKARLELPAVRAFRDMLEDAATRRQLAALGFER